MIDIHIQNLTYNAALQRFEARVDVQRAGGVFRYPCQLSGPHDMAPDHIAACLTHQALRMSDSPGAAQPPWAKPLMD